MSLKDILSQTFSNDAPVAESTGGSSVVVRPGEIIFPTELELATPNGTVKINEGRMFLPSLTLLEVTLRLQKPRSGRNAIPEAELATTSFDDPRVMKVLEFQVGVDPAGFELGILDPDTPSEFISLAEMGDKVASIYTDRPTAQAQTPVIHGQWMRVNDDAVNRLEAMLKAKGFERQATSLDGMPSDFDANTSGIQQFVWRYVMPFPSHLANNYGEIMRHRIANGPKVDSMVILKSANKGDSDFVDFLVSHQRKRDLITAGGLDSATEAQKDNRLRGISSLTGVYFSASADRGGNRRRGGVYIDRRNPNFGKDYTDGSWGRQWVVRPSVREMTIEGEYFSFLPGQVEQAQATTQATTPAVTDESSPF